jgi:anhydro-N-acetylmuramic acid kinase
VRDLFVGLMSGTSLDGVSAALVAELSARSIANAVDQYCPQTDEIHVCGGGAHNLCVLERLRLNLPQCLIATTAVLGIDSPLPGCPSKRSMADRVTYRLSPVQAARAYWGQFFRRSKPSGANPKETGAAAPVRPASRAP